MVLLSWLVDLPCRWLMPCASLQFVPWHAAHPAHAAVLAAPVLCASIRAPPNPFPAANQLRHMYQGSHTVFPGHACCCAPEEATLKPLASGHGIRGIVAPSILAANFTRLGEEVSAALT